MVAVTNGSGHAVQTASYSPYGEFASPGQMPPGLGAGGGVFGYTGRGYDAETGLYQYRARYYHPRLGQFLSADPIGTKDDPNLTLYIRLDPVNFYDPKGEDSWLASRPVYAGDRIVGQHMFVVVAPELGAEPIARFSYGPSREWHPISGAGWLVSLTDTRAGTDQDDLMYWEWTADARLAAWRDVTYVRINASDERVIAAGNSVNDYLGSPESPGPVRYNVMANGMHNFNSNTAALAVVKTCQLRQTSPLALGYRKLRYTGDRQG